MKLGVELAGGLYLFPLPQPLSDLFPASFTTSMETMQLSPSLPLLYQGARHIHIRHL